MDMMDWQKAVNEWAQSGLSKAEYCRQHKLTYTTFVTHTNSQNRVAKPNNSAISFVQVATKTVIEALSPVRNSGVQLSIDNVIITLDTDFDQATLSTVIGVLRAGA